MSRLTSPGLLSWIGLLGAPFAWAMQHVTGYALTEARCSPIDAGGGLHMDAWTVVVSALAATVAVVGEVAAVTAWRRMRNAPEHPPESRIQFVAVMGMTFTPLFLLIILMSGLGAIFLPECVQS